MALVVVIYQRRGIGKEDGRDRSSVGTAFLAALQALFVPLVILGGMGLYGELKFRDLPEILKKIVISTSAIMVITYVPAISLAPVQLIFGG